MTKDEEIRRAERAKLIIEDPLVVEAFSAIEQTIIGSWTELAIENKAQAEELKRLMWAAKQFKSIFEVTIAGGTVAKNELTNDTTMKIRSDAVRARLYG